MKRLAYSLQLTAYSLILLSTLYFLLSTYNVEAATAVSAQELLENGEEYDNKTVIFKGEVIGDIMVRQESVWINVRDKAGAIGVTCPKDLVSKIGFQGSYRYKGDIISVRGVFYRSCPQHGGDTDIHAKKITIIQEGEELSHPVEPQKIKASVVLPAIAFILAIAHLIIKRVR